MEATCMTCISSSLDYVTPIQNKLGILGLKWVQKEKVSLLWRNYSLRLTILCPSFFLLKQNQSLVLQALILICVDVFNHPIATLPK